MKKSKILICFCTAALAICLLTAPANAIWAEVKKDYNDFGHLANTAIDGNGACAATSMINSFKYLENKYPKVYDHKLIPDGNLISARDLLHNKIWANGPNDVWKNCWGEKVKWFEDHNAPVSLHGMYMGSTAGWYKPTGLVGGIYPTWGFMWEMLQACEDVEIFINYGNQDPNKAIGHALTLTSLKFNQDNPNQRKIDYLDSNNPTQLFEADATEAGDGTIYFRWNNGGANPPTDVYISGAFAESVPEPATILLLSFGGLALLRRRR